MTKTTTAWYRYPFWNWPPPWRPHPHARLHTHAPSSSPGPSTATPTCAVGGCVDMLVSIAGVYEAWQSTEGQFCSDYDADMCSQYGAVTGPWGAANDKCCVCGGGMVLGAFASIVHAHTSILSLVLTSTLYHHSPSPTP